MSKKGDSRKKHKSELAPAKRRRERAAERLAAKRTPKDQLAWLDTKGYTATKERARLEKLLAGGAL